MKKMLSLVFAAAFAWFNLAGSLIWAQEDERRQQLDTIRFGTEAEIAALIQIIRAEGSDHLDDELIRSALNTKNRNILTEVFGFFGEREKSGLEERAITALREREDEANETVGAAVDYLGRLKADKAIADLKELISSRETRFLANAVRALGRAANAKEADSVAYFLLDYFDSRNPSDDNRQEIITALGETGSNASVSFLSDMIKNSGESQFLRIAALEAISKIGSAEGLDAVIEAVSSADPNVRSAAVAALGPFSGEAVDNAILEGFRDSFFRTRIGASMAAGRRKLISAIPYLRFRAERDEAPAVRDEAIKALGAINNSETKKVLEELFSERKNPDRVRLMAAEMLLQNNADAYSAGIIAEMDDAKTRKQTALYNGFVRIMATAKSSSLEGFARRLIKDGGVIEMSLALDLVMSNGFRSLANDVRTLIDERKHGASIARKAQRTLERLGLSASLETI